MDHQPFIEIGPREIWDKLVAIEKLVADVPSDRKRIRALELKVYTIMSGLVAAMGTFGLMIAKGSI